MGNIASFDHRFVAPTYNRFGVEIVSGKGSILTDATGKDYIDMGTGIAVNTFGIADEEWIAAVDAQMHAVQHTSNLYYSEPCAMLAAELCTRTGMDKVFFGNSGAEANECAIKVARKYAADKKGPGAATIVSLVNSFHGRTLATLAATGQDHFHELFTPLTPGFVSTPANDLAAMRALIQRLEANPADPCTDLVGTGAAGRVAGIMLEMVQGEGGVLPLTPEFVQGVAELAKEFDLVLCIDEVQAGNGRSGSLYAYQQFGIFPDVVTTAKGLGGGLPLGACMMAPKVSRVLGFGDHGSTFGGNPIACAGALSILRRIDDACLAGVRERSLRIFDALMGAPGIESVSGLGLMVGVKTTRPAREVVEACILRGVICLTAKDKVRLLPALNIPLDLLDQALEVLKEEAAKVPAE